MSGPVCRSIGSIQERRRCGPRCELPIPILAVLPLDSQAVRIAHLDPDRARTGPI